MPDRAQGELAEALRRQGTLTADDFDRVLARAITEMNGWADCALLLTLAERHPSEAVKQALFYRCHHSEETSSSCAAMLCYLCGKAASPFDMTMVSFFAQFGLHVNYYQRRDALEKLAELTGFTSKEVEDFARIEREFHEQPPPVVPLPTTPAEPPKPKPPVSDWEPSFNVPPQPPVPRSSPVPPPLSRTQPPPLPKAKPAAGSVGLSDTYEIESEMRGEMIHYVEPDRRASMQFFWTKDYVIYADSITNWFYPGDRRTEPVTARQRVEIVARVVDHAAKVENVSLRVANEDWMRAELRREEIAAMRQMEIDLQRSTNHLGVCITLAERWRARVKQLVDARQFDDAINAYHRGVMWAVQYAAGATSGGEGLANSRERDEVIGQLRDTLGDTRPGEDPTGDKARAAIGEGPLA